MGANYSNLNENSENKCLALKTLNNDSLSQQFMMKVVPTIAYYYNRVTEANDGKTNKKAEDTVLGIRRQFLLPHPHPTRMKTAGATTKVKTISESPKEAKQRRRRIEEEEEEEDERELRRRRRRIEEEGGEDDDDDNDEDNRDEDSAPPPSPDHTYRTSDGEEDSDQERECDVELDSMLPCRGTEELHST